MKILKGLIIAAIVLFPFGELLRIDLAGNITIKPLDVIAGLITLGWVILVIRKEIKKSELRWYYLLFPVACILSLIVNLTWIQSNHIFTASLYLFRWISFMGIFFAVQQQDNKFKKQVTSLLFIDGLIIVILGYLQYFFFSSLMPLYSLGWDDHMYRLFSVFLDPNYTGGILVLYLLFLGGILYKQLNNPKPSKIALLKRTITKKQFIILLSLTMLLTLIALFLTFSRSALIMLVVSASCFFVLIGRKKLILWLLGILAVFIVLISSQFYVENINLFRHASTNARLENYEVAFSIIKEHSIFGVGFNTYRYAKDFYNIQSGWSNAPSHADAGVDNSFLFILVTTGIVGLAAYIFLWFSLLKRSFFLLNKEKNINAVVVIASCLGMFVHAFFINSLFFPAIMFWLWMQLALMERK